MATTKTRDELVDMAADELGITSTGNSAEAEDQEKIDGRVDGLFLELASRGVCTVSNDDAIPIEWTGPLAELLANECAVMFGRQKMAPPVRETVEERLRIMVQRIPPSDDVLHADDALLGGGRLTHSRWSRGY